jgi:hypothetical protein
MKNVTLLTIVAYMVFAFMPAPISAESTPGKDKIISSNTTTMTESAEAQVLLDRLTEIKKMKIKDLTVIQKKELRKEVKSIKSRLKAISGGVYISATAIIIILILLILFT